MVSKFVFFASAPIVVLALALVVANRPHLLLKVPGMGYQLFALLGRGEVPPCMDRRIFDKGDEWIRPKDVFVSVPAKSGTHWTMYTLNLMRARGNPEPFEDIYTETPWPEFVYYPGQPVSERVEYLQNLSRKFPFSIYKTHFAPPYYNYREDVRYVVTVRNTHDAVASLRTFYQSIGVKWAKMWGGFPPNAGQDESPEKWERFVAKDAGNGEPYVLTLMEPIEGWWPYRKRKNVLFVHYLDRIKDDVTQLKRISEFLELDLTPVEIQDIAKKASFSEMRKSEKTVEMHHILDEFKRRGNVANDIFVLDPTLQNSMMNRGPDRAGSKENSQAIKDSVRKMLLERFGPAITNWIENGGEIPLDEELPPRSRM